MESRLEDPEFIKIIKILFYITLGITIIAGFLVESHPYFKWEEIPGFYAVFGLISCILVIFVARALGRIFIQQEEDYYD